VSEFMHRDDLPMDIAEDAVEKLRKLHPGCKIVFAGDAGDQLPEEAKKAFAEYRRQEQAKLVQGLCSDCGKKMPGWTDDLGPPSMKLPEGWTFFEDPKTKMPHAWICPECDQAEQSV
jgi:hypothetical protein